MKNKYKLIIIFSIIISISKQKAFKLTSDDIKNNEYIPKEFTPYDKDINPSFKWENIPKGTKSFAFSVEDPDAPSGLFYHWILININKNINSIEKNSIVGKEIQNSWKLLHYKGPKPPSGIHHYHFVIYALDTRILSLRSYEDFQKEVNLHLIDKAEIVGLYQSQN
jgi:Raf kinase inhibitor-like YbhB/YbcL family protein